MDSGKVPVTKNLVADYRSASRVVPELQCLLALRICHE